MKTKQKKRKSVLVALLMSVCLLVSFVPTTVFAAEPINLPVSTIENTIESADNNFYVLRTDLSATFTPDISVNAGEIGEFDGLNIDYYNPAPENGSELVPRAGYDMHAEYNVSVPLVDYEGETVSGTLTVPLPEGYDGATARIRDGATAISYTATTVSFHVTLEVSYNKGFMSDLIEYKKANISSQSTEITKGANSAWQKGAKDGLTFTSNAAFADFQKVQIDGKDISTSNYTVKEGSTVVTLKAAYLETLSAGKHTISIVSATGTATTDFTIKAVSATSTQDKSNTASTNDNKKSPNTGNESAVFFAVAGAGAMALAVTLISKKKQLN